MSLRVGLGASQEDIDVQGEIDFDFFEESDRPSVSRNVLRSEDLSSEIGVNKDEHNNFPSPPEKPSLSKSVSVSQSDLVSTNADSRSSYDVTKPRITVSCDQATGVIKKTIETVIPAPYNYKESKWEKGNLSDLRKGNTVLSPRLKAKLFSDDHDISDDSSISSMSDSEGSILSTESEDSFEINDSDSMTDVSPLPSPYNCFTPSNLEPGETSTAASTSSSANKEPRKEGVKFLDEIRKKRCSKCETFDIHELVTAMNNLKMSQSVCSRKCKSPILTQNVKCRKNLSFSNEEVRKIDHDNQVLLKKIMAQQNRPKTPINSGIHVRASSAVSRQRHQRQIELDNLALLKRLESTKPSKNLSRTFLLKDYDQRSAAVLSRASSRSSYPSSSSSHTSGRSSAISIKSSNSSAHSKSSLSLSP